MWRSNRDRFQTRTSREQVGSWPWTVITSDAIKVLEMASNENDPVVLTYLGYSHRKLGDIDLGISLYKKALDIDPDNVDTREYLGEGYVTKGELDLAWLELVGNRETLRHDLRGIPGSRESLAVGARRNTNETCRQSPPTLTTARLKTIGVWALKLVLAAFFLFAGQAPSSPGSLPWSQVFEQVGFGQWFRYFTGVLELSGAALVAMAGDNGLGALLLTIVSIGAFVGAASWFCMRT